MKKATYLLFAGLLLLVEVTLAQQIQRVRVDFETPLGYTRQLLLGFTPDNAASDGFDYGYDAINPDNFPDDFNWIIEDERCIIQGVGAFDETKMYPVGLFLTNSGNININLNSTENFSSPIDVFIYDSLDDSYTLINEQTYNATVNSGEYEDRLYVTFSDGSGQETLSTDQNDKFTFDLKYDKDAHILALRTQQFANVNEVEIYTITGQRLINKRGLVQHITHINIPKNYTGVALIKLTTEQGSVTKKIIL